MIIFSSQIPDLLGLPLRDVPAEFLPKLAAIGSGLSSTNPWAVGLAVVSIVAMVVIRKLAPKAPGFLLVVVAGVAAVHLLGLPVETIGSRFGELPHLLPAPSLPAVSLARIQELLPAAFTIAFLAGVESLLSAVVADGMTGLSPGQRPTFGPALFPRWRGCCTRFCCWSSCWQPRHW